MGIQTYPTGLVWQALEDGEAQVALQRALEQWRGTRYESGQRFCQRGADCIGAVSGVIDQVDGRIRAELPGLPRDAAMHAPETARAAVRELLRRYSPCIRVEPDEDATLRVEPGDVVVTGASGGGPGHIALIGSRRNEIWHAVKGSGFHQAGWSFVNGQVLCAVYRIQDKWRWGNVD